MAELEDGWLPQNEAVEVDVDKLDFEYVKTCTDWKMLFQILRVLRSGKEGFFPDLESLTETRLLELMPEKIRRRYLAVKASPSAAQVAEAESELSHWLQSMRDQGSSEDQGDLARDRQALAMLRSLNKLQAEKIEAAAKDLHVDSLSARQREQKAERERLKGNECFKAFDLDAAV
eukprot:gene41622-50793_t